MIKINESTIYYSRDDSGRDNSDYWNDKNKEMFNHPDVGKTIVVTNPDNEFYRKSFKVNHVDGDTYYVGTYGNISIRRNDLKLKESNNKLDLPSSIVTYELPIRVQINYSGNYSEYDYYNNESYFEDIKSEAEDDWNSGDMIQYLRGSLKDIVTDIKMECGISSKGNMVCHLICTVSPSFTDEDSDKLKDWITGQMSDGWGEGFEQREVARFTYQEESEEYDEEEDEYYTEYYDETAFVYGQFWWSSRKDKNPWYIKEI